ncbi:MAG: alpha/beta hydrolase [Sphingomonas sp.]
MPSRVSTRWRRWIAVIGMLCLASLAQTARAAHLKYGWEKVQGLNIFFREGGPTDGPTLVFLHGNPSSSIQYQEVMEDLAGAGVHVLAMDYPTFGYSDAPLHDQYRFTFDNIASTVAAFLQQKGVTRYALYMQDYGVPVGFRLITANPKNITAVIVQNGVIHLDGFPAAQNPAGELRQHWDHRSAAIDARRRGHIEASGYPGPAGWSESPEMSPDAILLMTASEKRPGVIDSRNDLWFDYGNNVKRYPAWQSALKTLDVPVLVIWGNKDDFFTAPGAVAYLRDVPTAEVHILNTEHFATLVDPDEIHPLVENFMRKNSLLSSGGRER